MIQHFSSALEKVFSLPPGMEVASFIARFDRFLVERELIIAFEFWRGAKRLDDEDCGISWSGTFSSRFVYVGPVEAGAIYRSPQIALPAGTDTVRTGVREWKRSGNPMYGALAGTALEVSSQRVSDVDALIQHVVLPGKAIADGC